MDGSRTQSLLQRIVHAWALDDEGVHSLVTEPSSLAGRVSGMSGLQKAIYWEVPMKPPFSPSAKSPVLVKASSNPASTNLAHPLDLADGRRIRSTTVICVSRGDSLVMAADGQVSLGVTVMKG